MAARQVVAVDVGGTHVRFATATVANGTVVMIGDAVTMRTADHAGITDAWGAYGERCGAPLPRAAAIAWAGPVTGTNLTLTNSDWTIAPATIARLLDVDAHVIVNDFAAVAHAVAQAPARDFTPVCGPVRALPSTGIVTIVGPGTGLGVAMLHRTVAGYTVVPCEGGHIGFAPQDAVDDAVLAILRASHDRVSVERVVSGAGLRAIATALTGTSDPRSDEQLWTAALSDDDPGARTALRRFCATLGMVAGDLALAHGAGAVVIAGGLGTRLGPLLATTPFADRFVAKGRFRSLMAAISVTRITQAQPGLFGAAAAFAKDHAA